MSFSLSLYGTGVVLMLIQILAAIPWLLAFTWDSIRSTVSALPKRDRFSGPGESSNWQAWGLLGPFALVAAVGTIVLPAVLAVGLIQDRESLEITGRLYASVLQLQLLADLLVAF